MRQDTQQRRRSRGGSRRPRHAAAAVTIQCPELQTRKTHVFAENRSRFSTAPPINPPNGSGVHAAGTTPQKPTATARSARPERSDRPERSERQSRKPEIVEVNSPKLYVGNLSFDASESDLFDLFNGVGKVQNAEIVSNKYTQKSKGFAFVTLQSIEEARRAVTELHDKEYMGRKLVVSGAKTNDSADQPRKQQWQRRQRRRRTLRAVIKNSWETHPQGESPILFPPIP